MRWLPLPLLLALVGCGASLQSPSRALDARDRVELERMRALWVQHGYPAVPSGCDDDAEIVYPASDRDIEVWCKAKPCGTQKPGERCVDACQTSRFEGPFSERTPLLIVQKRQPRRSFRHELGHLWQACTGLPRDHSETFMRWLRAVEGNE